MRTEKTIRVDLEVYNLIEKNSKSMKDTANRVLRRLLKLDSDIVDKRKTKR